LGHEDNLDQ
jgi:hypothetical protein